MSRLRPIRSVRYDSARVDKKVHAIAPHIGVLRGAIACVHEANYKCPVPEGEAMNADAGQMFHRSKQKR